jgi:hypothetical protein
VLSPLSGNFHYGLSDADAAVLISNGYVPITVRVGLHGTQTMYILASDLANAAAPSSSGASGSTVAAATSVTSTPAQSVSQPLLVPFAEIASMRTSTSVIPATTTVAASTSNDSLLLLDQALAAFDSSGGGSQSDDDLLSSPDDSQPEAQQLSDLALAAAFDNETDWRNAI